MDEWPPIFQSAFDKGVNAGLSGRSFVENPFMPYLQEKEYEIWKAGWVEGFKERHSDR